MRGSFFNDRRLGRIVCALSVTALSVAAPGALAQDDGDGFELAKVGALLQSNGIAFDESRGIGYVASSYGGITVVDVASGLYLDTIDISREVTAPNGIAFAAGRLYVGTLRDIAVVDVLSERVVDRIDRPFFAGSVESDLVTSPDGTRVYAASGTSTALVVIDAATESAEARIPVGPDCNRLALSPDGRFAYLTNKERALLYAVDLDTRAVHEAVAIAPGAETLDFPCDVTVSSATGRIYVAWVAADYRARVTEFDSSMGALRTFEVGRFSTGIDATPDGRYALLGSGQVLDLETGFFSASLDVPQNGLSTVAFRAGSNAAVVTHGSERAIRVVSGFEPTLAATGTARVGGRLDLALKLPGEAGEPYQVVASNTASAGFPACDGIQFPLDPDELFRMTREGAGAFAAWSGSFDENGEARASFSLSRDLPIRGAGYPISLAFATFDGRRGRDVVRLVSNTVTVWLRP